MNRFLLKSRRIQLAAGATLLAFVMFLGTADEALRIPASVLPPVPELQAAPAPLDRPEPTPPAAIEAAIEVDPFSPTRQPPPLRYGAPVALGPSATLASVLPQPLQLVGTVVQESGSARSFVICQLGAGPPKVVRVGGKIGQYTLREITQGAATFVGDDGVPLDLRVPNHGS